MDESTRTWRDRVARWHKSGHCARVFAEQEGVNAGTLYSWSRRLGMKRSEYRQHSEKATLLLLAGRLDPVDGLEVLLRIKLVDAFPLGLADDHRDGERAPVTGVMVGSSRPERAGVLGRVKGSLAGLGGCAALNAPCAPRRPRRAGDGRTEPPAGAPGTGWAGDGHRAGERAIILRERKAAPTHHLTGASTTASIGAVVVSKATALGDLVIALDDAEKLAKDNGKNQVVLKEI
ncbi:IS66 family insertion sequence element accessory protein TnpA [Sorangium sp. So ce117]|uniref:IS66 family insertion sequence element accessory protein TnpA n=1 Tax=Sorangium sp. So ce117 TaxID=3133277 RepID=UPI003F5E776C